MKINIIKTTTNNKQIAEIIAHKLVGKKFAPCVQIIPNLISTYIYEEKIQRENEYLILIKTSTMNLLKCKELILKYHNYDVPEIIQLDAEILNNNYEKWFNDNCTISKK